MYHGVNGNRYWVKETGAASNPALVLLHGFTGTVQTWDAFTESWSASYRVIAIDLPGHGKTEMADTFSMKSCCDDLAAIFDQLQLEKAFVLGYSMGGRTALSFAMYYPEKVAALVLESASPGIDDPAARMERVKADKALAEGILDEGIQAFVDYWEDIPLFATQKKLAPEVKQKLRQERQSQNEASLAASLLGMGTGSQSSWWEKLKTVNLPVCLIAGAEDRKFAALNKQMAEHLDYVHFVMVSQAGHCIHVEQPRIFDKIVKSYLTDIVTKALEE